jgi:hypothetical protein
MAGRGGSAPWRRAALAVVVVLAFAAGGVAAAPPAQAVDLGECATMSSTIVRGADDLYVNASCLGPTGYHVEITGFEAAPDEPPAPAGWNPYFTEPTNFRMETGDAIAGEGFYRVHIEWLNSDETVVYGTAYITVKFTVLTESDLGVADLAHGGSTARGGTGTYTFRVTNSGQTANDVGYDVTLSAGASAPSPPAGCTTAAAPTGSVVHCVVGTLTGVAPVEAVLTVVNSATGSSALAAVAVSSPWAAEPEEGHPNQAQLAFDLTDPRPGPGGAQPVTVTPKLSRAGKGKVKGTVVRFAVRVSFAIPASLSGAVACTGKVTGSTKPKGVAKASTSKKSLSVAGATCSAKLTFKLPRSFAGTKVKVKAGFPGNAAVSAFETKAKLKLR